MSNDSEPTPEALQWAGSIWQRLSRIQCAGVLHIALRYGERAEHTNAYIDHMAALPWRGLGRPLQIDLLQALRQLQLSIYP